MIDEAINLNEATASMMTMALRNLHLVQDFSIELDARYDYGKFGLECVLRKLFNEEMFANEDTSPVSLVTKTINGIDVDILHFDDTNTKNKLFGRYVIRYEEKFDKENHCNNMIFFINDVIDNKTFGQISVYQQLNMGVINNEDDFNNGYSKTFLEFYTTDDKNWLGYHILLEILDSFEQYSLSTLTIKSLNDLFID